MKKIKKLMKKLNNRGSSVVMVIVALAFISIIIGALLSAAAYSYKLKIQNYNAKDNFYYTEQAMQEIYAGVGAQTIENLKDAYNYTLENMVRFDTTLNTYKTLSDEEANQVFKKAFMNKVKNNEYFKQSKAEFANSLAGYISNSSVTLDPAKLDVVMTDDKFVIKNITLTRTVDYDNVSAGKYTQTISADIEIVEPDFEVKFNSISSNYSNIYNYAMVADMGVEINQPAAPVSINGNIYAGADYYNKAYNDVKTGTFSWTNPNPISEDDKEIDYRYNSVSSKTYNTDNAKNTLHSRNKNELGAYYLYDGENTYSMYSGLYVDNTQVQLMSEYVIVPGTIAVMNKGELSVFYKSGAKSSTSEVWTDNIVLDGKSSYAEKKAGDKTVRDYEGSKATFRAKLFVRDDTEINAAGATFSLKGSYYGYGNSTSKDTREYVSSVNPINFRVPVYNEDGTVKKEDGVVVTENRGHYNSSAIVVNGEKSTLDFSNTTELYLAGRTYVELSKDVTTADEEAEDKTKYVTQSYLYNPTVSYLQGETVKTDYIRDYKTGESISIKSNQVAYIPVTTGGLPTKKFCADKKTEFVGIDLEPGLVDQKMFKTFFPSDIFDGAVPCIVSKVDSGAYTRTYYYYDFEKAYDILMNNAKYKAKLSDAGYTSADDFTRAFIEQYVAELNEAKSPIKKYLVDISKYEDYEAGNVIAPKKIYDPETASMIQPDVYSSGAITTKNDTEFNMVTNKDTLIAELLGSYNDNVAYDDDLSAAFNYSNDLEAEYNYIKWNLGHYQTADAEKTGYKTFLSKKSEAYVTPINKFFVMTNVVEANRVTPGNLTLASGYKVWVTDEDVHVRDEGSVKGIIITKGDVIFDLDDSGKGTQSFEGLIVSGGKVYVNGKLTSITASPEICRSVIKECLTTGTKNCINVLKVFAEYQKQAEELEANNNNPDAGLGDEGDDEAKSIETIDYSDVCSINNWMKNVE